jgi:hypothetical protein
LSNQADRTWLSSRYYAKAKGGTVRELRALGLTDDGKSLVLVDLSRGADGERFRVSADERLRAALRSGTPRAASQPAETRVESALSPREIQSRLRAGATAEEVAKAAGIPVGRVQRYEAPILAERDRVVSEARRASAPGPHRNTPGRPLGTLVDDRLREEAVEPESVVWDARRRTDGTWLVTLAMDEQEPARATWSWDPQARRVRAVDAGASAVLAPVPVPTTGPDSLTAVAEAAGVAPTQPSTPQQAQREAIAVGDDLRGRNAAPNRTARPNGLVVLPGRTEAADARESATPAGLGTDVPGGESLSSSAPRPDRNRMRAEASELLLPGAEPVARPSRQERLPQETSAVQSSGSVVESTAPRAAATEAPSVPTAPSSSGAVDGASVDDSAEPVDEITAAPGAPAAAKTVAKGGSGRRRSAVPAWDDIMFGARRG